MDNDKWTNKIHGFGKDHIMSTNVKWKSQDSSDIFVLSQQLVTDTQTHKKTRKFTLDHYVVKTTLKFIE